MAACPFCQIGARELDEDLVAHRTDNVYVLTARTQRRSNRGHALVLPVAHATDLATTPRVVLAELFEVVARVSAAMPGAFRAVGTTIFQNNRAPDQILAHLHVHVVPRFVGDGFRMPDDTIAVVDRAARVAQAVKLREALDRGSTT